VIGDEWILMVYPCGCEMESLIGSVEYQVVMGRAVGSLDEAVHLMGPLYCAGGMKGLRMLPGRGPVEGFGGKASERML